MSEVIKRFETRFTDQKTNATFEDLAVSWFGKVENNQNKTVMRLIKEHSTNLNKVSRLEQEALTLKEELERIKIKKKEDERNWLEEKVKFQKALSKALNLESERLTFLKEARDLLSFK